MAAILSAQRTRTARDSRVLGYVQDAIAWRVGSTTTGLGYDCDGLTSVQPPSSVTAAWASSPCSCQSRTIAGS